jgi:hypothetical protein
LLADTFKVLLPDDVPLLDTTLSLSAVLLPVSLLPELVLDGFRLPLITVFTSGWLSRFCCILA